MAPTVLLAGVQWVSAYAIVFPLRCFYTPTQLVCVKEHTSQHGTMCLYERGSLMPGLSENRVLLSNAIGVALEFAFLCHAARDEGRMRW